MAATDKLSFSIRFSVDFSGIVQTGLCPFNCMFCTIQSNNPSPVNARVLCSSGQRLLVSPRSPVLLVTNLANLRIGNNGIFLRDCRVSWVPISNRLFSDEFSCHWETIPRNRFCPRSTVPLKYVIPPQAFLTSATNTT